LNILKSIKRSLKALSVDLESIHRTLRHPIRRKILLTLLEKKEMTYVDLMNLLEVDNTGKFNYHLKSLGDLIEKNGNGKYRLTDKGHIASQLLQKLPEKSLKTTPLSGGDVILIGSVGFALALFNPAFWTLPLVGIGLFGIGIGFMGLVYALMVPSGVMSYLTVRRTNSNDLYDLFKPPLVTSALFVILTVLMLLLDIKISFTFSERERVLFIPLPAYIIGNVAFAFLGIFIYEILRRMKESGTLNIN